LLSDGKRTSNQKAPEDVADWKWEKNFYHFQSDPSEGRID